MSKRETGEDGHDFDETELINAEFESMVEGLSLDESSPTTYLDELDSFKDENRFIPPPLTKKSFLEELKSAQRAIIRWKNNRQNQNPEDGATL